MLQKLKMSKVKFPYKNKIISLLYFDLLAPRNSSRAFLFERKGTNTQPKTIPRLKRRTRFRDRPNNFLKDYPGKRKCDSDKQFQVKISP